MCVNGQPLWAVLYDDDHDGVHSEGRTRIQKYLQRMGEVGQDTSAAMVPPGGCAEALIIAHLWNMTIYIVQEASLPQHYLLYADQVAQDPSNSSSKACLIYKGGHHFDVLVPTDWGTMSAFEEGVGPRHPG